MVLAK